MINNARRGLTLAAIAVVTTTGVGVAVVAASGVAFAADPSCAAALPGSVAAHLAETVLGPGHPPASYALSEVQLLNVPSSCDGAQVSFGFYGNAAGDPSAPTSLLGSASAGTPPCGSAAAYGVSGGGVTVPLCPTDPGAHPVLSFDLVSVTWTIDGVTGVVSAAPTSTTATTTTSTTGTGSLPAGGGPGGSDTGPTGGPTSVLGITITRPPSAPTGSSPATGVLAFTGSEIGALTSAAAGSIVAGSVVLWLRRRTARRR